jgi:hypothetical protein
MPALHRDLEDREVVAGYGMHQGLAPSIGRTGQASIQLPFMHE